MPRKTPKQLEKLQSIILHRAIVLFLSLALAATLVLSYRSYMFGEWITLSVTSAATIGLLILYVFRNRIKNSLISGIFVALIFAVLGTGLFKLGILAAATYYISLVPVFTFLTSTYRKAIFALAFCLLMYAGFGYLYYSGSLISGIDVNLYMASPLSWVLNLFILGFVGMAILDIVNLYSKNLERSHQKIAEHRDSLKEKVEEKTENLYRLNQQLSQSNDELLKRLKELRKAQNQLLEKEKMASLGMLTAGIAHELKTPLNYISSSKTLLKAKLEEDQNLDEESKQLLDFINTGTERMNSIIKGLNQFSRDQDRYDEECDIPEIIDSCLEIINHLIKGRLEVKRNYQPIKIEGNVGKLHQVFTNLLTNAAQAIEGEGELSIEVNSVNQKCQIAISDNGCGISPENLKKIQDPFFTTKAPGVGTGLGLSITKRIVEEHQGQMKFNSEINKGTTVSLQFPY